MRFFATFLQKKLATMDLGPKGGKANPEIWLRLCPPILLIYAPIFTLAQSCLHKMTRRGHPHVSARTPKGTKAFFKQLRFNDIKDLSMSVFTCSVRTGNASLLARGIEKLLAKK